MRLPFPAQVMVINRFSVNAEEPLPGDDFVPVVPNEKRFSDAEKFDFPSADYPIPTYDATFGQNDDDDIPPPVGGPQVMGPRFFSQPPLTVSTELPFEQRSIMQPSPAYTPTPSSAGSLSSGGLPPSVRPLVRHGSQNSQRSFASFSSKFSSNSGRSYTTDSSGHGRSALGGSKDGGVIGKSRWVIE